MFIINLIKKISKLINYIIILLFLIIVFSATFIINSEDYSIKHERKNLRNILKSGTIRSNLLNDYNQVFLPETQYQNFKFDKLKLEFLNPKESTFFYSRHYTFFIEENDQDLFVITQKGNLYFIKKNQLTSEDLKFKKIETNIESQRILDMKIFQDNIYLSTIEKNDQNYFISIKKSKLNKKKFDFQEVFVSPNNECISKNTNGGKIEFINKFGDYKILLSVGSIINMNDKNQRTLNSQNNEDVCGKIILIDLINSNFEIYAKGLRNVIGLYSENNITLATDNGPFGGDEINKIERGDNFGWPISSYGEKYFKNKFLEGEDYFKNHNLNGFVEPIFAFVPSIGISEIIKIPNSFSKTWQNNYLIGSLNGKSLYRVKFNDNYSKLIYYEKIFVGDRIRDIIYLEDQKKIIMALEHSGSIGIISKIN